MKMLRQVMGAMDLLDDPRANGEKARKWIEGFGPAELEVKTVQGESGSTDFIKAVIRSPKPSGPTLGIIGRLGGVGARPERIGLVSDADGCIVALACAAKLAQMTARGDGLPGDVIVATHICPDAPTTPHDPIPFMGSPVDIGIMNRMEVDPRMTAILSVDATKGNWVFNQRGFAITPTVREGYILRISERLLEIMRYVTGQAPAVLAITTQDITPYGNGIYHMNSIMQPAAATAAPVVGIATTAAIPVAGCATGANQFADLELAGRFCIEVAKAYTAGMCPFYDEPEYQRLLALYGTLAQLQRKGPEA
jgi:hypothetical protein